MKSEDLIPQVDSDCEMLDLCTNIGLTDNRDCRAGGNALLRCKPGQKVLIKLLAKTVALLEREKG